MVRRVLAVTFSGHRVVSSAICINDFTHLIFAPSFWSFEVAVKVSLPDLSCSSLKLFYAEAKPPGVGRKAADRIIVQTRMRRGQFESVIQGLFDFEDRSASWSYLETPGTQL
jgi:hypothetical protein